MVNRGRPPPEQEGRRPMGKASERPPSLAARWAERQAASDWFSATPGGNVLIITNSVPLGLRR